MTILRERHGGAIANAYGVAWVQATGRVGVVAGGGWATVPGGCSYTDTDTEHPNSGDGKYVLPIAGSLMEYDAPSGNTYFTIGFLAPPGTQCCAHIWTLVP